MVRITFKTPSVYLVANSNQVFILGTNFNEARLVRVLPFLLPVKDRSRGPDNLAENPTILLRHRPPSLRPPPRSSLYSPHSAPRLPQQPNSPRHNFHTIRNEDRKRFTERAAGKH